MRKDAFLLAIFNLAFLVGFSQEKPIKGFSTKAAAAQIVLEKKFDQQLSNTNIGKTIQELAAKPHHLGSPQGKLVAESILNKFKAYGMPRSKPTTSYSLRQKPGCWN